MYSNVMKKCTIRRNYIGVLWWVYTRNGYSYIYFYQKFCIRLVWNVIPWDLSVKIDFFGVLKRSWCVRREEMFFDFFESTVPLLRGAPVELTPYSQLQCPASHPSVYLLFEVWLCRLSMARNSNVTILSFPKFAITVIFR
jgi:hypothetical protein